MKQRVHGLTFQFVAAGGLGKVQIVHSLGVILEVEQLAVPRSDPVNMCQSVAIGEDRPYLDVLVALVDASPWPNARIVSPELTVGRLDFVEVSY